MPGRRWSCAGGAGGGTFRGCLASELPSSAARGGGAYSAASAASAALRAPDQSASVRRIAWYCRRVPETIVRPSSSAAVAIVVVFEIFARPSGLVNVRPRVIFSRATSARIIIKKENIDLPTCAFLFLF